MCSLLNVSSSNVDIGEWTLECVAGTCTKQTMLSKLNYFKTSIKPSYLCRVVKTAHGLEAFWINNKRVKMYTYTTNTSYTWGCYHTITNHTIYVCRGTTPTVYFKCKSRTNYKELTPVHRRTSQTPIESEKKQKWMAYIITKCNVHLKTIIIIQFSLSKWKHHFIWWEAKILLPVHEWLF